jgi:hypothetical protein
MWPIAILSVVLAASAPPPSDSTAVAAVLDALHAAASRADEAAYFALFDDDAVFVGTDATEVWTVAQFRAYAHPHFAKGQGWTYVPDAAARRIRVSGDTAWFYEPLRNEKYGATRGSGVLVRRGGTWKIAQYVLSFAIPNDAADDVVGRIRKSPPTK